MTLRILRRSTKKILVWSGRTQRTKLLTVWRNKLKKVYFLFIHINTKVIKKQLVMSGGVVALEEL